MALNISCSLPVFTNDGDSRYENSLQPFHATKNRIFFRLVVIAGYTGVDNKKKFVRMTRFFSPNVNDFTDSCEQTRMIKSLAVSHFSPSLVLDRICLNIKNRVKFIHSESIKL